jgi:hypothetical protein
VLEDGAALAERQGPEVPTVDVEDDTEAWQRRDSSSTRNKKYEG